MQAIARKKIPVRFHRIPYTSPICGFNFWKTGNRIIQAKATIPSSSQFLDINTSWDDFNKRLTSKNRDDLNRAFRKAERTGPVCFEFIHADKRTNTEQFGEYLSLELKSWKAKNRSAITSINELETFFVTFTLLAAENKYLYYAHMKIGDRLIAAQFFVIQYGRRWTLKIAHDEEYKFCSPGALLMREVTHFAFERGLKGVEFLGHSEL